MHDIICPHCGEKFIARDVVFDFSPYILPLITKESNYELIAEHGFKYYIDEEDILNHPDGTNEIPLIIDNKIGPSAQGGKFYMCKITNAMIVEYISAKTRMNLDSFSVELDAISQKNSMRADYSPGIVSFVEKVYYNCFLSSSTSMGDFDISSDIGSVIVEMLCQINENRETGASVGVRMFCERMNASKINYYVPDILFVLNATGHVDRKFKCCRCCNSKFPAEFGYYKMVPVTLLGSHFSGKTSLLLALLWFIRNKAPFNGGNANFRVSTLTDDPDLESFNKNIENYMKGLPPLKTDFVGVPILSMLINDNIYTFIDWPGEAFINNSDSSMRFAYDSRRIIADSRHFIFCLEPVQVAPDLSAAEEKRENVNFDETTLMKRFNDHISLANLKNVRSISFVVNKFDMFIEANYPGSEEIKELIANRTESDIFDANGNWSVPNWDEIIRKTLSFIKGQISTLIAKAQSDYRSNNVCFVPAAPYGRSANEGASEKIKRGYLVGLPLLHILKSDGIIK